MRKLASTGIHLTLIGVTWYPVDSILNQLVRVNRFTIDRSVYWEYSYININLNLYAYDTSLTIYAYNNELLTKYLQLYIDKLVYWFNINKLKLNIEKTKCYLL